MAISTALPPLPEEEDQSQNLAMQGQNLALQGIMNSLGAGIEDPTQWLQQVTGNVQATAPPVVTQQSDIVTPQQDAVSEDIAQTAQTEDKLVAANAYGELGVDPADAAFHRALNYANTTDPTVLGQTQPGVRPDESGTEDPGRLSRLFKLFQDPGFQQLAGVGLLAAVSGPRRGKAAEVYTGLMDKAAKTRIANEQIIYERERNARADQLAKRTEGRHLAQAQLEGRQQFQAKVTQIRDMAEKGKLPVPTYEKMLNSRLIGNEKRAIPGLVEAYKLRTRSWYPVLGPSKERPGENEIIGYQSAKEREEQKEKALTTTKLGMEVRKIKQDHEAGLVKGKIMRLVRMEGDKFDINSLSFESLYPPGDPRRVYLDDDWLVKVIEDAWRKEENEGIKRRLDNATIRARISKAFLDDVKADAARLKALSDKENPLGQLSDKSAQNVAVTRNLLGDLTRIRNDVLEFTKVWNNKAKDKGITLTPEEVINKVSGGVIGWWNKKSTTLLDGIADEWGILWGDSDVEEAFLALQASTLQYQTKLLKMNSGAQVTDLEYQRNLMTLPSMDDMAATFFRKLAIGEDILFQAYKNEVIAGGLSIPEMETGWSYLQRAGEVKLEGEGDIAKLGSQVPTQKTEGGKRVMGIETVLHLEREMNWSKKQIQDYAEVNGFADPYAQHLKTPTQIAKEGLGRMNVKVK
ncbi:MAG: hypothetical protein CMB80_01975 [Flammeovirgaceae bacterium]|nr:hypothetical protein [Flammeovirgaceae bacterium]